MIDPLYHRAVLKENSAAVRLSLEGLECIPLAARRRVIRRAIERVKGNLRRIAFSHIDAVDRLALKGPHAGSIDLPDRIQVRRDHQALVVIKQNKPLRLQGRGKAPSHQAGYSYEIKSPGSVYVKEAGVHLKLTKVDIQAYTHFRGTGQGIAFFDINKVKFPLLVRNFQPGDRFSPLGMTGSQKLKKFFNSNKIPRDQRAICPLLVSGGRIIWVAGHRLDNSVKVDADTRGVLKAELLLA
jgi:tRNA(Ile)-lysidine synthase